MIKACAYVIELKAFTGSNSFRMTRKFPNAKGLTTITNAVDLIVPEGVSVTLSTTKGYGIDETLVATRTGSGSWSML